MEKTLNVEARASAESPPGAVKSERPRSGKYLGALQWLRGFAAVIVVIFHATEQLYIQGLASADWVFHMGSKGVDLFFVISGFIITYAHRSDFGRSDFVGIYSLKRIGRILPLYWTIFLPLLFIRLIIPDVGHSEDLHAGRVFTSLFLIPQAELPILGVAWTLSYELFFYFLFGIAVWNKRLGLAVGLVLATLCVGMPFLFSYETLPVALRFIFSPYNLEFGFGVIAAVLFVRGKQNFSWGATALMLALGAGLYGIGHLVSFDMLMRAALWGGGGALLTYVACVFGGLIDPAKHLWARVAEMIGSSTYSIYLVHYPLLVACSKFFDKFFPTYPVTCALLGIFISVGAGMVTYYIIEAPQQKSIGRFVKGLQEKRKEKAHA